MKKIISIISFALLFVVSTIAQQVVYNNAYPTDPTNPDVGLTTSAASGCSGGDESVLQNVSLGMTTLGFGVQSTLPATLADDFVLDQDCDLQTMTFYAYQTSAPNAGSISSITVQIYDGDPNAGGTVIWGDLTTNVLANNSASGIFRVAENDLGSCARAIQIVEADVTASLTAGSYWVEWQMTGSASFSGPWAPPITVVGSTTTGNAQQFFGGWGPAQDGGTATPQGLPFLITASPKSVEIVPTMGEWGLISLGMILMIFGVLAIRQRKTAIA